MPSINMIAARRADKHRLELRTRNLVYAILAEASLFMVVLSFMVVQVVTTQGKVGDLNDKIAKLKPQVLKIQNLEQQTADLQPKLTALANARNSTMYLYTAFQNVTNSLSSSTWLANLASNGDVAPAASAPAAAGGKPVVAAAGPQLNISGSSLNQSDVGLTMLKMNQFPQFDHVTLNYVQQAGGGPQSSGTAVQFQMIVQLHPLAPPASAKKATGDDNVQKS